MINLIDKRELSKILGLAPSTIVKMAQAHQIPHYKFGHRVLRFDPAEIKAWIAGKKVEALRPRLRVLRRAG